MRRTAFALLLLGCALPASACGPEFPQNLLDDRSASLANLPRYGFRREVAKLVPAPAKPFVMNEPQGWQPSDAPSANEIAQRGWFGDAYPQVERARGSADAATAYALAERLPEEARRYLAGAVAFDHGETDQALARFASVLELPAGQRLRYGPWAQYMQGRLLASRDPGRAMAAFAAVRDTVAAGAEDPLGLALSSYGEQARLRLDAGDTSGAVQLYAEQAAQGSQFGWTSLLLLARRMVDNDAELEAALRDPLSRRLVVTYVTTRSLDYDTAEEVPVTPDIAERILTALEKLPDTRIEGVGPFAAFAYQSGRYDLAGRFAARGSDGLSSWVRAKLALRAGDMDAASAAYAQAAKAFPLDEPDNDPFAAPGTRRPGEAYCRVLGESGTLALARGEYIAAMEHFFRASNWEDAAFVAESVLTLQELQDFVANNAAGAAPKPAADEQAADEGNERDPASALRALLARRLLRNGEWDDALRHFDDAGRHAKAQAYVDARRAAERGSRIDRAKAWYEASLIARVDGMELLGYEFGPDMAAWDGVYPEVYTFGYAVPGEAAAVDSTPVQKTVRFPFATGPIEAERQRVEANAARPDKRYHYRYVAADFAARAADLVPNRSQAYAALLCTATGHVLNDDVGVARGYWRRYVANGPHVPWAEDFGRQCQAPDFPAAAARLRAERIQAGKRFVKKSLPYAAGPIALAVVLLAWQWRRRRAVRKPDGQIAQ